MYNTQDQAVINEVITPIGELFKPLSEKWELQFIQSLRHIPKNVLKKATLMAIEKSVGNSRPSIAEIKKFCNDATGVAGNKVQFDFEGHFHSLNEDWTTVARNIRLKIGDDHYYSWFKTMDLQSKQYDHLVLKVKGRFVREWILSHYENVIKKEVVKHFGDNCTFEVVAEKLEVVNG